MKLFLIKNKNLLIFISLSFFIWIGILSFFQDIDHSIPIHKDFINPSNWANFDGTHYISIGKIGYVWQEQAFFPFYPILIHFAGKFIFHERYVPAGFFITLISLPLMLFMFGKLILLDFPKKTMYWILIFLLLFPTGFFLRAAYTESLFLLLTISSFYFSRRKQFVLASLLAGCASATRIIGIFIFPALLIEYFIDNGWKLKWNFPSFGSFLSIILLAPSGLISYMFYLWLRYKDPILFFHNLSIYGEQRSANKIILLPQVLFRYIKILLTVSPKTSAFQVALLEFSIFIFISVILIIFWKKLRLSYFVYSLGALILPTLSGSLSSFPRYALAIFPVFIILGIVKNTLIKCILLLVFLLLEGLLCMFFLRGYFIS